MKCNVGKTEQAIRILVGVVIILIGFYFRSWLGLIGLAPIITGLIRYCPASEFFGISTCDMKNKH